ncbi:hypothetical protein [Fodinibius halophilus]|uniref:Uncharacterized protein n=1 Tax=Fodinibius halophilus TaxID=1736908 RepID=A0A6M1TE28_9BACT|nr:hypothetical protein [Fodinibius halophilus]NGP88452.1 hypothetical protein [Fodinibius halophilus]
MMAKPVELRTFFKKGSITEIKKALNPRREYTWKSFLNSDIKAGVKIPILSLFTVWDQKLGNNMVRRACLPNPPKELGEILSHYYILSVKLVSTLE